MKKVLGITLLLVVFILFQSGMSLAIHEDQPTEPVDPPAPAIEEVIEVEVEAIEVEHGSDAETGFNCDCLRENKDTGTWECVPCIK